MPAVSASWYGRPGLSRRSGLGKEPMMRSLLEVGGKKAPFLRWSALRMGLGMSHLMREWQVGDGREDALADYVLAHARPGDVSDAIRAVDEFCYQRSVMMNVGDEKGLILETAITRTAEPPVGAGDLLRVQRPAHGAGNAAGCAPMVD